MRRVDNSRSRLDAHHVALALLVGLVLRLAVVWRANSRAPNDASRLFGDEPDFNDRALGLLDGVWFNWPTRMPLYPTFVAAVHWLSGRSYDTLLYVQAVGGVATIWLAHLLGRRLFDRTVGVVAAWGTALHWTLVMQSTRVLSEVLFTPLLLVFVIALVDAVQAPSVRRFVAAGGLLALTTYVRPTTAAFPLALGCLLLVLRWNWRDVVRYSAVFAATTWLLLVPWTVHNAVQYHTFLPLTTNIATLWQGGPEYYDLYKDGRTYLSIWQEELNPERNGGYLPGSIAGDRHFDDRAIDSIRDRPLTYAWYSAQKAIWLWIGHPSADRYDAPMFRPGNLHQYWSWWEVATIMAARLVPLLAAVSVIVLWRDRRRLAPVYSVLLYFTVVYALTWADLRYSDPTAPMLLVLVAGMAVTLLRRWVLPNLVGHASVDEPPLTPTLST